MEQRPIGDGSGGSQQQPEIILTPAGGSTPPAPNKVCPNCGTVNPVPSLFCYKCGMKLPDITTQGKKICSGCQTPNAPTAQYCYKCGLPLPENLSSGYENKRYAGFWVRLVASLIDDIFLYIVNSIVMSVILFAYYGSQLDLNWLTDFQNSLTVDNSQVWSFLGIIFLAYLVGLAVTIAYYTITIGKWGRTLGKAALKIKVVKHDGSRVSYWRALGRSLAYYLNGFTLYIGFLIIAFTKEKRGLHDYIADTIVIKTD